MKPVQSSVESVRSVWQIDVEHGPLLPENRILRNGSTPIIYRHSLANSLDRNRFRRNLYLTVLIDKFETVLAGRPILRSNRFIE